MMSAVVSGLAPLARVPISAGTFAMGSTLFLDAQPVTDVTVSSFEVSETKVTIGAYQEYLRAIGDNRTTLAVTDAETGDVRIVGRGKTKAEAWDAYAQSLPSVMSAGALIELGASLTIFEVTDPDIPAEFRESPDQPMIEIDWQEMLAFAAAHGGDLPTEAEYERVQRGRSGEDEYGTVSGKLRTEDGRKLAQFCTDWTSPVRTHPANSWGVYDASGNVWTWTKTWYSASYVGLGQNDPRGLKGGTRKVLRGGSYYDGGDYLHAAYRFNVDPTVCNGFIGGVVVWRSQDSK